METKIKTCGIIDSNVAAGKSVEIFSLKKEKETQMDCGYRLTFYLVHTSV